MSRKQFWILSTGTELTRGYSQDTNSREIAQSLVENGFDIRGISLLPDNKEILKKYILNIIKDNQVTGIIMTGGLGPTDDDYTVDVLSEITQYSTIEHEKSLKKLIQLQNRFPDIDLTIAKRQIRILNHSIPINNSTGIAPGMIIEFSGKWIIALPGVPTEMKNMLPFVIDFLNTKFSLKEFYQKEILYIYNEPESEFQKFMNHQTYSFPWGVSAKIGFLKIFIENNNEKYKKQFLEYIQSIKTHYQEKITQKPVLEIIHKIMITNKRTLACAESCTGGWLGKVITDLPGSSQYFLGSLVTYSNMAKTLYLNVPEEIIQTYGAVSKECAQAMVKGLIQKIKSDYGIAITGIAGPTGGTKEKPIGTVYIAIATPKKTLVKKILYPSTRERIREYTINLALFFLYCEIKNDFTKEYNI